MNSITMGELGEIGWYLKLESISDKNRYNGAMRKEKERERIRQPLFQFRYDGKSGKFIREMKENSSVDNATKDPNFINGYFTTPGDSVMTGYEAEKISPMKGDEANKTEPDDVATAKGGANTNESVAGAGNSIPDTGEEKLANPDVSRDQSYHEDVFERRRKWGKGISVYRLVNGKF